MIPENLEQTFASLLESWKAKDWDQARPLLNHICENTDIDEFEQAILQSVDTAKGIAGLFMETGIDKSPEGSPTNAFYKRTIGYIVRHEFLASFEFTVPPPALLPEMQRFKRGEGPYPFEEVAAGFGLTPDQLVMAFEKILVMETFNRQGPGPGVTIH